MFNKVLLALTLSDQTDRLLEAFYSICASPETEVLLLPPWMEKEQTSGKDRCLPRKRHRLEEYATKIRNAGYGQVRILPPLRTISADALSDLVYDQDIDLLLREAPASGTGEVPLRWSRLLHVLQHVEIPTFLLKGTYTGHDYLRRVLLPTDFSRSSLNALRILRNLREQIGEVLFVHVLEDPRDRREDRGDREVAEEMLEELQTEMQDFGIRARYILARGHTASHEVCRIAEEEDCSLVFVAQPEAGAVRGLLRQSTSKNIAELATRSLWIIPDDVDDD
ncbi:MAG: universal stress protein [Succiniclasticum sp.]|jgi:nucleotide-binding universal stress UspA family protein